MAAGLRLDVAGRVRGAHRVAGGLRVVRGRRGRRGRLSLGLLLLPGAGHRVGWCGIVPRVPGGKKRTEKM